MKALRVMTSGGKRYPAKADTIAAALAEAVDGRHGPTIALVPYPPAVNRT